MELNKKQVEDAVQALKLLAKDKPEGDLLDSPEKILLIFSFKKVPRLNNKIIKIYLPHGLATDNQFVCLFVKDLDRKDRDFTQTVEHFKDLFSKHGVRTMPEIIPMKALKTMYKPFEAKRHLSDSFDLHLADARIVRLLPSLLGKHFYGRKRHPVQVDLTGDDLKTEISRAINNGRCIISGKGSSNSAYIAHTKHSAEQIVDNVMAATRWLGKSLPGGLKNIRSFHLKTETSTTIPVYTSLGSPNEVVLHEVLEPKVEIEAEDVTTVMEGKVRVYPDGNIEVVSETPTEEPVKRKRKNPKPEAEKPIKVKKPRIQKLGNSEKTSQQTKKSLKKSKSNKTPGGEKDKVETPKDSKKISSKSAKAKKLKVKS